MAKLPKIMRQKLGRRGAERDPAGALKAGEHPDANLLAAFVEQSLTKKERMVVMSHLADCAECREHVALAFPPDVETLSTEAASFTKRTPAWLRWPILRWGTAVAALGIVLIVVLVRHRSPKEIREITIAENRRVPTPAAAIDSARQNGATAPPQLRSEIASAEHPEPVDKVGRYRTEGKTKSAERKNLSTSESLTPASQAPAVKPSAQAAPASELAKVDRFRNEDVRRGGSGTAPVGGGNAMPPPPPAGALAPAIAGAVSPEISAPKPNLNSFLKSTDTEVKSAEIGQKTEARAASKPGGPAGTNPTYGLRAAPQSAGAKDRKVQVGGPSQLRSALAGAKSKPAPRNARWSISSSGSSLGPSYTLPPLGKLERSLDGGRTWEEVHVDDNVSFRVVFADGPEVWAGGSLGALYHSADGGEHWVRVNLTPDQAGLTDAIVRISFSDPQHGTVTTAAGERWITADAGQHWERR